VHLHKGHLNHCSKISTCSGAALPSLTDDERTYLLNEAAEARALASQMRDPAAIRDLLEYAKALCLEAERVAASTETAAAPLVGTNKKTPSHP